MPQFDDERHARAVDPSGDPKAIYAWICDNVHFFRREITVEEVTGAVLWLASEETRNITAHALPVSAGGEYKMPAPEPYFTI